MKQVLRGVNLGGWLILEKWMTPSVFKGVLAKDEYTFMQTPGAADKIEAHRAKFITEEDFRWLAENGINAIRLPVGYWVLEDAEPYTNAAKYLDFAVEMCEKYRLKLLIDLHGAPGSQNGRDHSGRIGKADWYRNPQNVARSIDVLESLVKRYHNRPCVWGYQLLNEPKPGLIQWRLRRYYRQAYAHLTNISRPGVKIVFHDAFTTFLLSGVINQSKDFPVVIDRHWYHFLQIFKNQLPIKWYFKKLDLTKYYYRLIRRTQDLIIGEWSGVIAWQDLPEVTPIERKELERRYINLQLDLYDNETDGWFYWSYKTEKPDLWNFRSLVEKNIIKLN